MFKNKDYSFLSKMLHHLALGNNFIPEMLHDIEIGLFKKKLQLDNLKSHMFVCGLPRSGSTILMRYIYGTKLFASKKYPPISGVKNIIDAKTIKNIVKPIKSFTV